MKYFNPIVKGFYPDPSVCRANGKFYMVNSSFQYFPGVPLFESPDLVNWTQIGHVLTRKSQVMLEKINSSGGVFAPTIRYNDGRFYMVTTNDTYHRNFYVWTDDIYGEWSEPVFVDQGGIDPSLYFENGKAYFMSNGMDGDRGAVLQCEIELETGKRLTESRPIWHGTGGRYLESPHLYKINGRYYLMAAEGGTEYGHMITYAVGDTVWGEFKTAPNNPVLTNKNRAPFIIQGIGHGDLIEDNNGNWHILCLGFRQSGVWSPYHHLGREVFLSPVSFNADGTFSAGTNGTVDEAYELEGDFAQDEKKLFTFENTEWDKDWCFLRHPHSENYTLLPDRAVLRGTDITLETADSPTFVGIRQRDFNGELRVKLKSVGGETGVSAYMTEIEHYDIAVRDNGGKKSVILKLNIGEIKHIQAEIPTECENPELIIKMENYNYIFSFSDGKTEQSLGYAQTKYLSSEVAGGFTGVVLGLYAIGGEAEFSEFFCKYSD